MEPGAFSIADPSAAVTRAAGFVDQSLTGAKPADIPVERPIKLELLINLKSAKILGPKIPEKLLALASEAIE